MAIKILRLPSDQFRARGYKATSTRFFLLKTKNNQGGRVRVGIVVGRSVHKTAVKRNFWKRQALAMTAAHASAGNDILIVFSPNVNRLTKKQFNNEMTKAFTRAAQK